AFYFLFGGTIASAAFGGIATSVAVMIRPNLVPLCGVLVLWLLIRLWRRANDRRNTAMSLLVFLTGMIPGVVATALINRYLYGSLIQSGYGDLNSMFRWTHVLPNLENYSSWFVAYQTPIAVLG